MQYGTLFILLDNYIPLVLSINSLTLKLNNNLQSTSEHGSEYMSEQMSLQCMQSLASLKATSMGYKVALLQPALLETSVTSSDILQEWLCMSGGHN